MTNKTREDEVVDVRTMVEDWDESVEDDENEDIRTKVRKEKNRKRKPAFLEEMFSHLKELVAANPDPLPGEICSVCGEGKLYWLGNKIVVLEEFGRSSRAGDVLRRVKKALAEGRVSSGLREELGKLEIPDLDEVIIELPMYVCTNLLCPGLFLRNHLGRGPHFEK